MLHRAVCLCSSQGASEKRAPQPAVGCVAKWFSVKVPIAVG